MLKDVPLGTAQQSNQALNNYLQIDLLRLVAWLRAKHRWIIGAAVAGLLLGVGFSLTSTPQYVVTSQLLVDPTGLQGWLIWFYRRLDDRRHWRDGVRHL
jgi:uncharacterized protein involved in exopolysaccharide biosynthesis